MVFYWQFFVGIQVGQSATEDNFRGSSTYLKHRAADTSNILFIIVDRVRL